MVILPELVIRTPPSLSLSELLPTTFKLSSSTLPPLLLINAPGLFIFTPVTLSLVNFKDEPEFNLNKLFPFALSSDERSAPVIVYSFAPNVFGPDVTI